MRRVLDYIAAVGEHCIKAGIDKRTDLENCRCTPATVDLLTVCLLYTSESIAGPGGMPVGTNGQAMLLLSGGIDSPVAGYMIAKRGVKIDAVYSVSYTHLDVYKRQVSA